MRFTAYNYGSYSSNLLLEFRNSPRPVLCIKFHVEVLDVRSQIDLLALNDHNRPINFKIQSWERERFADVIFTFISNAGFRLKSSKRIIRSEVIKAQFTFGVKSRTHERILFRILVNCSLYAGESARGVPNLLLK